MKRKIIFGSALLIGWYLARQADRRYQEEREERADIQERYDFIRAQEAETGIDLGIPLDYWWKGETDDTAYW